MYEFGRKQNVDGENAEKNISNEKMSKEKTSIVWKCRMKITIKYLEGASERGGENDREE
jgi:hypothetical protein